MKVGGETYNGNIWSRFTNKHSENCIILYSPDDAWIVRYIYRDFLSVYLWNVAKHSRCKCSYWYYFRRSSSHISAQNPAYELFMRKGRSRSETSSGFGATAPRFDYKWVLIWDRVKGKSDWGISVVVCYWRLIRINAERK